MIEIPEWPRIWDTTLSGTRSESITEAGVPEGVRADPIESGARRAATVRARRAFLGSHGSPMSVTKT